MSTEPTFDCVHATPVGLYGFLNRCALGLEGGTPHINVCRQCTEKCTRKCVEDHDNVCRHNIVFPPLVPLTITPRNIVPNFKNAPWPTDVYGDIYYGTVMVLTENNKSIYCDKWTGKELSEIELEERKNETFYSSNNHRIVFTKGKEKAFLVLKDGSWTITFNKGGGEEEVEYRYASKTVAIQKITQMGWSIGPEDFAVNFWNIGDID